jgi:hypothetical protein
MSKFRHEIEQNINKGGIVKKKPKKETKHSSAHLKKSSGGKHKAAYNTLLKGSGMKI